jgi:hypothetical protein
MAKKKVYTVLSDPKYEPYVVGIFSTEKKALKAIEKATLTFPKGYDFGIEEWLVDDTGAMP